MSRFSSNQESLTHNNNITFKKQFIFSVNSTRNIWAANSILVWAMSRNYYYYYCLQKQSYL